ncbi:heavy-metal-associated domain-containing protein [Flavobacterium beibuense]|uniref:heavy-metal-associated domain-containing protein n=1 Tax=Flavobacterium beibuense TaxID=657326 RepID=UPI0009FC6B64|nr:heavy metal-associated domain-containing protein [Flavobacterium beibuense]
MNSIKKIAFFALTAALFASCKDNAKNNMEAPAEGTTNDTTATAHETAANLETTTFKIDGMTCPQGCAATIESKLAGMEGVQDAKVDFESKTATVSFDASKQTPETLVTKVEGIADGAYKVSDVKSSGDKAYYSVDQEKEKAKKTTKKADDKSCSSSDAKKEGKSCCGGAKKCSSETKKEGTM